MKNNIKELLRSINYAPVDNQLSTTCLNVILDNTIIGLLKIYHETITDTLEAVYYDTNNRFIQSFKNQAENIFAVPVKREDILRAFNSKNAEIKLIKLLLRKQNKQLKQQKKHSKKDTRIKERTRKRNNHQQISKKNIISKTK